MASGDMGLAGGADGPKAALRRRFPEAWSTASDLHDVGNRTNATPEEILAVVDGNVAAMAVPQTITSLLDTTNFLVNQFARHLECACNVVVVLDNPATLTRAKVAEQCRRDASRKRPVPTSCDLAPAFSDDNFLARDLRAGEDIRAYIANRATRMRIVDAVFAGVFRALERKLAGRLQGPASSFSIVGCDARGGNRPVGEKRTAGVMSTDEHLEEALEAVVAGEGDLKLSEVVEVAMAERSRRGSPLAAFKTAHLHTIDTDSILIELAVEARRMEENKLVNTFVVFRERLSRSPGGEGAPRFTLLDLTGQLLFLIEDLFGLEVSKIAPGLVRPAIALFVMCQAAQGTDFCGLKGLRTLEVLDACRVVCSEEYQYLSSLPSIWKGVEGDLRLAEPALRRVLSLCGSSLETVSRRKVHASSLKDPDEEALLRVLWTARYWLGEEIRGVDRWGFVG